MLEVIPVGREERHYRLECDAYSKIGSRSGGPRRRVADCSGGRSKRPDTIAAPSARNRLTLTDTALKSFCAAGAPTAGDIRRRSSDPSAASVAVQGPFSSDTDRSTQRQSSARGRCDRCSGRSLRGLLYPEVIGRALSRNIWTMRTTPRKTSPMSTASDSGWKNAARSLCD